MILTLTPNPSVDRTISIDHLERGEVQRATDSRVDPGGKGINVSRALLAHGVPTLAVLPIGGAHGQMMTDLLAVAQLPVRAVPIAGSIRANVALVEPGGTTTKVNEQGPQLSAAEATALMDAVEQAYGAGVSWVVGCGSLPGGMSQHTYAELVRRVHARGGRVAIDSSGTPMALALAAGPDLIKPNREELAEVVGRPLETLGQVVEAAREVIAAGIATVLVSLGKDGAVLVGADEAAHASARVDAPLSTVGAGDCTLAGYLSAQTRGADPAECLATAVAFGAAAVALPGSRVPGPDDVARITVAATPRLDPTTRLTD